MTMHLYALVEDGSKTAEKLAPVWGASKLKFSGDWYEARADCFRHAMEHGHSGVCIVGGDVQLYRRPLGHQPHRMEAREQYGLWLYLDRLLRRYGHAYVPPLAWARNKQHEYFNSPTIPLVAAYSVRALQDIKCMHEWSVGWRLCAAGHDSFTVSDYFHHNLGSANVDEYGSATQWKDSYERALSRILGPSR